MPHTIPIFTQTVALLTLFHLYLVADAHVQSEDISSVSLSAVRSHAPSSVAADPVLPSIPAPDRFKAPPPPVVDTSRTTSARLTLRHIEAGGIGYNHGYTSGTAQIFPTTKEGLWAWPFVDIRAHEFNDNTQAANVGFGYRFKAQSTEKVFGFNVYYDFRNTGHHSRFNQAGIGFELLGKQYDLRINGYFPFGKRHYTLFRCNFNRELDGFSSVKRVQVALWGLNAEFGGILKKYHSTLFYAAAGPYYFGGDVCHKPFGGRFRLNALFRKYLFLEGSITYDKVYKTRLQGLIGVTFPLGWKPKFLKQVHREFPDEMFLQPVYRHEIIVIDKNCWWKKH